MKILITGGRGMLGRTLCAELKEFELIPTGLPEADITDEKNFCEVLKKYRPDVVIHCAAMTAVDKCETEEEKAFLINASGSENVAKACSLYGIRLIAISTDYVFDGTSSRPYTENDIADGGRTVYGKSKFAGEEAIRRIHPDHVICRVSWLYGSGGPSFVHTMLALADGSRPELKVVADQIGNPTSAAAVARKLREIIQHPELTGVVHMSCEGEASWAEFAAEIFRLTGRKQIVVPCTTAEFPRPAPRPANSRLEKMVLRQSGLSPMPHWKDALKVFLETEFPENGN